MVSAYISLALTVSNWCSNELLVPNHGWPLLEQSVSRILILEQIIGGVSSVRRRVRHVGNLKRKAEAASSGAFGIQHTSVLRAQINARVEQLL